MFDVKAKSDWKFVGIDIIIIKRLKKKILAEFLLLVCVFLIGKIEQTNLVELLIYFCAIFSDLQIIMFFFLILPHDRQYYLYFWLGLTLSSSNHQPSFSSNKALHKGEQNKPIFADYICISQIWINLVRWKGDICSFFIVFIFETVISMEWFSCLPNNFRLKSNLCSAKNIWMIFSIKCVGVCVFESLCSSSSSSSLLHTAEF